MQGREFLGVYSNVRVGAREIPKRYFFVWSNGTRFDVQKLDAALRPVDIVQTVDEKEFRSKFMLEPDIKEAPASERARQKTQETVDGKAKLNPSEVENAMREHFRKAMQRFKKPEEKAAALASLKTLAEVEEGITSDHKHMFADFGIDLRKVDELALALAFCKRVLQLSPDDDHAYFNTARVLMDMGKLEDAEQHLLSALYIVPNSRIYKKMLRYIQVQRLQVG